MKYALIIILILLLAVLAVAFVCFYLAFYAPRKKTNTEEYPIPAGSVYAPYREQMVTWIKEARAMGPSEHTIVSFDGLTLYGKYYEYAPNAPMELMFHGYRGNAERDLSGGVQRCFALGHSALIVDQRCSGKSSGRVITFGLREHRDCLSWIEYMRCCFGDDVKIILTGISMGAATVMLAAGEDLPPNVIGVLADCGYTDAKTIISVVIKKIGLPVKLAYPFVRLGGLLFGGFDIDRVSPREALKKAKVPVIFFHGEQDGFVPCEMSRENYDACPARKRLVTVPGADHGLSYPMAPEEYLAAVKEFFS